MPRTKKTPTPDLEARVAALERAVMTLCVHLPANLFDEQARADEATRRVLARLHDRVAAAGTLARLELPEPVYDEVFGEGEALPSAPKALWQVANRKLGERLVGLGLCLPEEVRNRP